MTKKLLAIDQGTTSSRVIIYDEALQPIAFHQQEFEQYFPKPGWVEHDPADIWRTVLTCCKEALAKANVSAHDIAGLGITNQRETTIGWRRSTGEPIANAIVWQDRRTKDICQQIRAMHGDQVVQDKTGLVIDAYFSATKMQWLIEHVAKPGNIPMSDLLFGTVDTYLIWQLTRGRRFVTDITNASRTMLFNIHTLEWDVTLLEMFGIQRSMLPEVLPNVSDFGVVDHDFFGAGIPICGVAGDQQAAMIGQVCFNPGDIKCTLGTGAFVLMNTGKKPMPSSNKLLTTIGYQIDHDVYYALEASIFNAGTVTKWLRDKLHAIDKAAGSEQFARALDSNDGVYLVPAFTGLGAPHWNPDVRGTLVGITRDTSSAHIVRAGLESVAYQMKDLVVSMVDDAELQPKRLRVDGGMSKNTWLLQFIADMLQLTVDRPVISETTALGAAMLASIGAGLFHSLHDLAEHWQLDCSFEPAMSDELRQNLYHGWQRALKGAFAVVD